MTRRTSFAAWAAVVTIGVLGASFYANLSFDTDDPKDLAWFPPFKEGFDHNHNDHVGAEYGKVANALYAGRGYSDPFGSGSAATAWMPPILPLFQWGILAASHGSKDALINAMIVTQTAAILFTAWLVLAAARKTAPNVPLPVVVLLMTAALVARFHMAFQVTHDTGLIMAALDLVLIGILRGDVFATRTRQILWGLTGGFVTLVNPIIGVCWGAVTLLEAVRLRSWKSLLLCGAMSAVVLAPWTIRNAIVFHRFIPVKSNLAYELYQGQVHNREGRLRTGVFSTHPNSRGTPERFEYTQKGEMAFLDAKRAVFWQTVRDDPKLFAWKVWDRVLAVGFDYSPMGDQEYERQTLFQFVYLTHPLAIFAAMGLAVLSLVKKLPRAVTLGLVVFACYLAPYALVSYYERYETPVWGLKVLVIVWWLNAVIEGLRSVSGISRGVSRPVDTTDMKAVSAGL